MSEHTSMGRAVPSSVWGMPLRPYRGPFSTAPARRTCQVTIRSLPPRSDKVTGLEKVMTQGLSQGGTACILFDPAERGGLPALIAALPEGVRVVMEVMDHGVATHPELPKISGVTGCVRNPGELPPLREGYIITSPGGVARGIMAGRPRIDALFLLVPRSDPAGNCDGVVTGGTLARFAENVFVIAREIDTYPLEPATALTEDMVDAVVQLDWKEARLPAQTAPLRSPTAQLITDRCAEVMEVLSSEGRSCVSVFGDIGREALVTFAETEGSSLGYLGPLWSSLRRLVDERLLSSVRGTSALDEEGYRMLRELPGAMDISHAWNPHTPGCAAHRLDIALFTPVEMDTRFNANTLSHPSGGFPGVMGPEHDAAVGAFTTVAAMPLMDRRLPRIRSDIVHHTVPGHSVDIVVTEWGIARRADRKDLKKLLGSRSEVVDISELARLAEDMGGAPEVPERRRELGLILHRDGTALDILREV